MEQEIRGRGPWLERQLLKWNGAASEGLTESVRSERRLQECVGTAKQIPEERAFQMEERAGESMADWFKDSKQASVQVQSQRADGEDTGRWGPRMEETAGHCEDVSFNSESDANHRTALCKTVTWSDPSYLHKRIALAAVLQIDSKETALRSSCWMDPEFRREGENGGINRRVISICMKLDEIRKGVFYAQRRKRPSLSPQREEQEKRRK